MMLKQMSLFISFVAVLAVSSQANANLVGRWDFEGVVGTNVPDQTGHGHDGTIVDGVGGHLPGSTTPNDTSATIIFDSSHPLGGNNVLDLSNPAPYTESNEACCGSFVEVADHPDLQITGDMSMALWFTHRSSFWNETVLLGKGWDYGILEYAGENKLTTIFAGVPDPSPPGNDLRYWMEPIAEIPGYGVDTWHHVAITFDTDTGERKLYFDGVLEQTDTLFPAGATLGTSNQPLWIGSSTGQSGGFSSSGEGRSWDGKLDDVRIYDHTLTLAEVAALVPEPASIVLLGIVMVAAGARLRRKQ